VFSRGEHPAGLLKMVAVRGGDMDALGALIGEEFIHVFVYLGDA